MQFNFLVPAQNEQEVEYLKSIDLNKQHYQFNHSTRNWTLQTYLMLREKLPDIACNHYPVRDAINIGHCQYLRKLKPSPEHFIVSISGEYRHLLWAHAHIVQNKVQHNGRKYFFIPHWGQPGLIPRNPERQTVEHVAYAGRPTQLSSRNGYIRSKFARFGFFTSKHDGREFWNDEMKRIGMRFSLLVKPHWNDLSDVDILLGIRSFDRERYNYLPPTKLINAWNAGIPFIGGNDSAYEQVGIPGRDYIKVSDRYEAIEAIKKLRDEPAYYNSFVEAGFRKARKYSRENTTQKWITLLTGPIKTIYDNWIVESEAKQKMKLSVYRNSENLIRRTGDIITMRGK